MVQQFIGRTIEIDFLEQKYASDQAEFIVLYGRRRIGKTELIHHFTKEKPHLYFQCEKSDRITIMREFHERAAKTLADETFTKIVISSWYELFEEFVKRIEMVGNVQTPEKYVIAIDEFPYLTESNKAIPSIFQKVWDEILSKAPVMLILCGSSIGMMERDVLSSKSPLFGRRTGQILLRPVKINEIQQFFPDYSFDDIIRIYSVCDGIPAYLEKFDPELSFIQNIEKIVLNKNEYLYAEGEFILKSEFREYRNYFLILSGISKGKRSFNEITNATNLDKGLVSKYLSHLQSIHLIEVDLPVTQRTNRSRKARYRIADNFMKFWFRFIHSNRHELEEYGFMRFEDIQEDFSQYMGRIFEEVCTWYVFTKWGKEYPLVGSWWNRKGEEIDIVALDHSFSNAILGECKWGDKKVGVDVFNELVRKQEILETETKLRSVLYVIISRGGFTKGLIELSKGRNDLILVRSNEMKFDR